MLQEYYLTDIGRNWVTFSSSSCFGGKFFFPLKNTSHKINLTANSERPATLQTLKQQQDAGLYRDRL